MFSSVVKTALSVREVFGLNTGLVKSDTVSPRARRRCGILRSYVTQALSRGDGPHVSHFGVISRA